MKESTIARFHTASAVLMGATGLVTTWLALATTRAHAVLSDWPTAIFGLVLAGVGGVSLARKTLTTAVLARGAALSVMVPRLLVTGITVFVHHHLPPVSVLGLAALATGGFLTIEPWVSRGRAARDFEPVGYRGLLLGGATSLVALAFSTAHLAIDGIFIPLWARVVFGGVSAVALAAGLAVLRMRAWGVLLGMALSLGLVGAFTAFPGFPVTRILAYGAGALLVAPLLLARWPTKHARRRTQALEEPVRIAIEAEDAHALADEDESDLLAAPIARSAAFDGRGMPAP